MSSRQAGKQFLKAAGLLPVLSVLCLPVAAFAQQYYDPGLLQRTIEHVPADYQQLGTRLGSFTLDPGVELVWEDNDNIFYLPAMEIGDTITHVRPWAYLRSDWNRHELNFTALADIASYSDFSNEDYEDVMFSVDGRIDVRRNSYLDFTASLMGLHEDRSSPDDVFGIAPTEFDHTLLEAGYTHIFNRLTASLKSRSVDFDYDNNFSSDGSIIDMQDRDRALDSLELRLSYELTPQRSVFLALSGNEVDYDRPVDNEGFLRSSDGIRVQAGLSLDLTGVLFGDLFLEYFDQDFDDPSFDNIDGFGLGARLLWTPTRLTHVDFTFDNGSQETTQPFTSGYSSAHYAIRVQHELRRNLLANLRVSLTDNDYEFNGQEENFLTDTEVFRGGIGLTYLLNQNVHIAGGYTYERQDSNAGLFDYKTNRYFLTLGLKL